MPSADEDTLTVESPDTREQDSKGLDRAKASPERQTKEETRSKPKRQPPYAVVLHNDPVNGFDHVIAVLKKVFHYAGGKAFLLTLRAHLTGRSIIWTGSLEVAELKAEQVRSCGPDPNMAHRKPSPLKVTLEPLP